MSTLWLFTVAVGPLLLIGLIVWAVVRNKRGSPADVARAERGAEELREELAEEDEN